MPQSPRSVLCSPRTRFPLSRRGRGGDRSGGDGNHSPAVIRDNDAMRRDAAALHVFHGMPSALARALERIEHEKFRRSMRRSRHRARSGGRRRARIARRAQAGVVPTGTERGIRARRDQDDAEASPRSAVDPPRRVEIVRRGQIAHVGYTPAGSAA